MCAQTRPSTLLLPADERAPARARRFLAEAHCRVHHGELFDEAQLLVSEVVTNAVRHGAPPVTLEIACEDDGLVVRVSDGATAMPVAREAALDDESGRGVSLVDLLSDDWGVEPTGAGKQVWFRLRRQGPPLITPVATERLWQVHPGASAAVLLVDLEARAVVFANDAAAELAPGVRLPVGLEEWSRAAGLLDVDGEPLSRSEHPLSLVAQGRPVTGKAVRAGRGSRLGQPGEPLWAVGLRMADSPQLRTHALVVLLTLHDRDPADAVSALTASPGSGPSGHVEVRDRAVLATGVSFTVADARAPDLPLVWVNPAFTATTGYTFTEAVGRNCRFLQGPGTDPAAVATMRAALTQDRAVSVTAVNYRKDGTAFWNEIAINPVHDRDGRTTHFVGIQTDVTARVAVDVQRDRALAAESAARRDAESAQATAEAAQAEAELARIEAERAHGRLALLAEGTSLLAATLDVQESIERLITLVVPLLADWAVVALPDARGDVGAVVVRHRDGHEDLLERYARIVRRTSTRRSVLSGLLHGQPARRIADLADVPRQERAGWVDEQVLDLTEQLGASSVLLVPLPGRRAVVGAMALLRRPGSTPHDDDDLAVAADLGRRAGLILDNARLYQDEHRIAETLQRGLLPDLPDLSALVTAGGTPPVTAAARYRASESGAQVGGDFYELIAQPGGALTLAVGDVVGHDVYAAAAMGHLRGLLRACAFDNTPEVVGGGTVHVAHQSPAAVLERVDRLVQGLDTSIIASVAFARLTPLPAAPTADAGADDGSGERPGRAWLLEYATAGHPPLLVRHPGGRVEMLDEADGMLLGVEPHARTGQRQLLLAGSTLLAYTDGLVERRGSTLDQGLDRLCAALATGPQDVEALCDHLITALGHDSQDDIALLALRL